MVRSRRHASRQHGLAVLPVALILLAGAALILLFSQKNLLTDLQITRNGYGSRLAYAAADSGLAAALVRLNDPAHRKTLLGETKGTGAYDAVRMPTWTLPLGEAVEARVTLRGISLGGPDVRLQIQSTGCVSDCSKGRASASQMLVLRGGIHQIPFSLLNARGALEISGTVTVNNQTPSVRGMLMHAGGIITRDASVMRITLPGQNPDFAELGQDKRYA